MGKKTKPSVAPMMEILSETKKKKKKKHTVDPEEESTEPVSPEKTRKKKKLDDNLNIEHSPSKEDALLGNEESAEEMEVVKKKKKKKNKKEGHDESLNDSEVLTDSQKSPKKRSSTGDVKSSPKKLKKEKRKVEDEDEENDENEQVNIDEAETLDLWTTEERLSLISKMQEKIQPNDKFSYRRRLASAKWKWDEVAFGNKSAKECEDQFNELIHHITKVKTLEQILLELEQLTKTGGVRKKNLNPFQCFMKEHTQTLKTQSKNEGLRGRELFSVLINKWYSLDEKEKGKYKARAKEEASWEGYAPVAPRLPFEIYYDIESEKIGSKSLQLKNELKTKYASLKKKAKVKYIEESFKEVHEYKKKVAEYLKQNPSYRMLKKQPNKEETELYLVNHLKMPKGPPFQTRIAYYHRLMEEGKLDNVIGKDKLLTATRMFAKLPTEEQKAFTEETRKKFEEFQEKFAQWREKQEDYLADVIKRYEPEQPVKKEKVEIKKKVVKLEEFKHTQVTVMGCPKFNDPPKRPPSSGFFLFSAKFEHKMKGKFSTMKERKQSCRTYWEKLPDEHKQIYNNRCKELKEEYHKNLLEFVGKLEEGERMMFLGHYRKPLRKFFRQDVFEEKYPNRIYPVYITSPTKKSKDKVNGTTVKQEVEEDDTSSSEDDLPGAQNKTRGSKKREKKTKNMESDSSDYSSDEEEEGDIKPQLQKKEQELWDSSNESSSDSEDKIVKTPKLKQRESSSSKVVKSKSPTKKQTPLAAKATSKRTTEKGDSSSDSSSDESDVVKPSWMTPTSQKSTKQTAESSEDDEDSED